MPDAHFLICGISAPAPGLHRRGAEHWTVPERDAHFLDICWRRRPVLMLAISQHLIAWCWSAAAISDTVTLQLFPIVFFCSLLQLIFSLRKKSGQIDFWETSVRLIFEFALKFFFSVSWFWVSLIRSNNVGGYFLSLDMIATFHSWLIWPCIDRGLLRWSKIHQFCAQGLHLLPIIFSDLETRIKIDQRHHLFVQPIVMEQPWLLNQLMMIETSSPSLSVSGGTNE